MLLPQEIIRAKRDGKVLSDAQISAFIAALALNDESAMKDVEAGSQTVNAEISESQIAAFTMAVYFNGMSLEECIALTMAMRDSGRVLDWKNYATDKPIVDKHSTGGVGDNISLMLAPLLAACDVAVPMISGRGLGHTGGTLDKLESIPGYQTQPGIERFMRTVNEVGCAIIGQTDDLAPADRRMYAVRDVTATVESIPLITASILSKKLAAGLDSLVLDVKTGSGAFMVSLEDAKKLARQIVKVANGAGLATSAVITDMDQPLAAAAGNALEVRHALEYLTNQHRDARVHEVTMTLCCQALTAAGVASDETNALARLEKSLDSGEAANRFARMVVALGGSSRLLDDYETLLPTAACVAPVFSNVSGVVSTVDTRAIGLAVVALGGGRKRASDAINPAVGISGLLPIGSIVDSETPLAMIHAQSTDDHAVASDMIRNAYGLNLDADDAVMSERTTIFETIRQ